jgi:tetratricopeptide (TPR) repeat protein
VPRHPTPDDLEGFLLGTLSPRENRAVLLHLSAGCERCQLEIGPLAAGLAGRRDDGEAAPGSPRGAGPQGEPEPGLAASYDAALSRAFEEVGRRADTLANERRTARPVVEALLAGSRTLATLADEEWERIQGISLCDALLALTRSLRHRDPAGMVRHAYLALLAARALDPARYGRDATIDLQARALAELANAYRVADALDESEAVMAQAVELSREGSGDPLLLARIAELLASLASHRRRFGEALELLDEVTALYRACGDRHQVGRALIKKGIYTGYGNQPQEAIRLLGEGLALIEPEREPLLALSAVHDRIWLLVDCGRCREARRRLFESRALYERAPEDCLIQLKLRWLEGRIAASIGASGGADAPAELTRAERAFAEVRQGLRAAGLGYHEALVSLDLGAVWLRQGRTAETRGLVAQAIEVFRALQIGREGHAALLLLHDALERDGAALGLLQSVADFLKRLEHEPGLCFEAAG